MSAEHIRSTVSNHFDDDGEEEEKRREQEENFSNFVQVQPVVFKHARARSHSPLPVQPISAR